MTKVGLMERVLSVYVVSLVPFVLISYAEV